MDEESVTVIRRVLMDRNLQLDAQACSHLGDRAARFDANAADLMARAIIEALRAA